MRILVDAFGGDHSPEEVIKGGLSAIKAREDFTLVFVGKESAIEEELNKYTYDKSRVEILNASEVIGCDEEPTKAIMKKKDSSLCVAFKELKENADGFVSAGSTGAVLVGATLRTGRIKGVSRPALCPILPTIDGDKKVLLLDAGANADCKVINLVEFAIMGSVYAEVVLGTKNPKVALLSNGTEDSKGNALNHEVFGKLKELDCINFIGNIEARDILSGEIDVVVTDGFSGNVALKSLEGGINTLLKMLKQKIYSSLRGKIGGLLLKKTFAEIKEKMDYNKQGGAVFLGVEKVVVKSHGSSKEIAIKNSILQALDGAESRVIDKIKEKLNQTNLDKLRD